VITTIVTGILSPVFLRNPFIRLCHGRRNPLAIAEGSQIITQMILKNRFRIRPNISFDLVRTIEELHCDYDFIIQAVVAKEGLLMDEHLTINYG
jgi:hypothetical protein